MISHKERIKQQLFKLARIYSYVPIEVEFWLEQKALEYACPKSVIIYSAITHAKENNVAFNIKKVTRACYGRKTTASRPRGKNSKARKIKVNITTIANEKAV